MTFNLSMPGRPDTPTYLLLTEQANDYSRNPWSWCTSRHFDHPLKTVSQKCFIPPMIEHGIRRLKATKLPFPNTMQTHVMARPGTRDAHFE